jgi:non-canonical (house-cleaning) NTP pyrophosphatase
MNSKPKIIVTSQSKIKLNAVKNIFSEYIYDIVGIKTDSGIPEQPLGFEEIENGTMNRLNYVLKNYKVEPESGTIYISIENGLLNHSGSKYPGDHFYDIANIAILYVPKNSIKPDLSKVISSWSAMVPISRELFSTVPDDQSVVYTPGNDDPHKAICDVTREEILTQGINIVTGILFSRN